MFRIQLHWKLLFIALILLSSSFIVPTLLFAQGTWTTGPSPTTSEPFDGVGGAINGKFYMVAQHFSPILEIYDPATNSWTSGTPMSSYREIMIGGVVNNKLYVGGGRDWNTGGTIVSTFEMYDPTTDSWTPKAAMPTPLFNASAVTYNGKLYVVGGYDGSNPVQTIRIYDPTTNSWSTSSSMATPRVKAALGVINGKIYVAGGGNGGAVLNTLEIYNPATNSWTTGPNMSVAHYSSAFGVINNELYVVSGRTTDFNWTNVTEIYNPSTGWRTDTAIPTTRDMSMSAVIGNKLYVVGGGNMNGYNNVFEIYEAEPPPIVPICTSFVAKTTSNSNLPVNAVTGVTLDSSKLYLTLWAGGLAISTDGGSSYTLKNTSNGFVDNNPRAVVASGNNIYVGTYSSGLAISTDGGNTFTTRTTANGLSNNNVTAVQVVGSNVYVGIQSGGLAISTDGGNSFTSQLGSTWVTALDVEGSTIYASSWAGGLYISTDGGNSFSNKTTADGLPSNNMRTVEVVNGTIYAGTEGGLAISTDGGNSFVVRTTADGLGSNTVADVAVADSVIYVATFGGLSISTNGGTSFTNYTIANGLGSNTVNSIYANGTDLYIGTDGGLSLCGSSNTAPTANAGLDQNVTGGMPVQLDGSLSTDPDDNLPLTYRWTQTGGTTVSLSEATASNPSFTAPTAVGSLTFSLVVTDSLGLASTADQVVVTVDVVPILNLTAVSSAPNLVGRTIYFTATVSQGSNVNYNWNFGDGDSATGATVSHVYNMAGNYVAGVTASNSLGPVDQYVNVDITNTPPIANAGSDRSVGVGTTVTLAGSASYDPDGHTISYQWNQFGGAGVGLSNSTVANPTFVAPTMPDVLYFDLMVTDQYGGMSASDQVVITVVNNNPVAHAGPDQTVNLGATVTLTGSGSSDPDGHSLTYQWTQIGGTPVSLSNPTSANPTFTAPASAGTLTFQLEVTDAYGLTDSTPDTVVITVAEAPPPFLMSFGSSGTGNGQFQSVYVLAIDNNNNVYAGEHETGRIQIFDSAGNYLRQWGGTGSGIGQFNATPDAAFDNNGNLYVVDHNNHRVQKLDKNGNFVLQWGGFNYPIFIAIDSSNNIYVTDQHRVQKFNSSGTLLSTIGTQGNGIGQFYYARGVAVDSNGNIYVTDRNHRLQKFDSSGTYLTEWGGLGTGEGQFNAPDAIFIDSNNNVYVSDNLNNRIQKFTSGGIFLSKWGSSGTGNGQFNNPVSLVGNSAGNLYIGDFSNHRIQKFGTITAINGLTLTTSSPTLLGNVTFFTATQSAGSDLNYTWNFGDGSVTTSGQPATITHTYATVGNYTTIVTATNNAGSSSRSATIAVVQCFASLGSTTQYSSGNAQAVRDAITAATTGQVVKIAGNCPGAISENGSTQVAYVNKAITLRGGYTTTNWTTSDPAVNVTKLDAQGSGRVLYINGVNLTLENLTLQNGSVAGPGGGVYASNNLTLTSVSVRNSTASGGTGEGGGIYASGVLSVSNSTFALNSAGFRGGSIRAIGNAQISNSQILSSTSSGHGGGVAANAQLILVGGLFQNNLGYSSGGGVIIYNTGSLIITNTQFISNSAGPVYAGGGVYQQGNNSVLVNGAWFERNYANDGSAIGGGGAAFESPNTTILNTSWISNSVNNGSGGGLYLYTSGTVINNTFRGNSASSNGGALYSNAGITITNSIFQDNHSTSGSGGALIFGGTSTISGTQFLLNGAADAGGAIYSGGSLDLINTQILSNTAPGHGGGVFLPQASLWLRVNGGLFQNNVAGNAGGGVMISSYNSVIVTNTQFISNTQLAVWGGGALYHQGNGSITITGAWFERNSSPNASNPYGGGAVLLGATASISNTSWISNSTGGHGGAVAMSGTIRNNTFRGNSANGTGGAAYTNGSLDIINSTFTANSASLGSAIYNNGTMTVNNSTISANNGSTSGGALYTPGTSTIYLRNTIIANSIGSNNDCENWGTMAANINNLIETNNGCSSGATGLVTADPNLGPLADNGGIVIAGGKINQTFALNFNSPAIEAGNNATCDSSDGRGIARPIDGNSNGVALCDIGAYEAAAGSANVAPVTNAGVDQTVYGGTTVTLTAVASSDADGHSLTYRWTQTGGTTVTLSSATAVSPTFTAPSTLGMLTFTLRVTDSLGLAATLSDTVVITVFEAQPTFLAKWGTNGSGNGQFSNPFALALDSAGNLYVADSVNNRIQKFDSAGNFILGWGSTGSGDGQFTSLSSLAIDANNNLYATDIGAHRVQKFNNSGTFLLKWGAAGTGNGQFNTPHGIAVDSNGMIYVADHENNRIQKFDSNGNYQSQWGSAGTGNGQFNKPAWLAIDATGNLYVSDHFNHRIQKFGSSGNYLGQWGGFGAGNGQFNFPSGVALDPSGNLYVTDILNYRVQKFTSNGVFLTKWGSQGAADGQFQAYGIAVNIAGNIYVADMLNKRIQKFGSVTAISGLTVTTSGPTNLGGVTYLTATLAAGTDVNYTWNYGDGSVTSSGQPATITHTYASGGTYTVVVTATNNLGSNSANKTVLINRPPLANAGVDQSVVPSATVTLNGSASSDPEGQSLTYRWTQIDGEAVNLSSAIAVIPTFTAPSLVTNQWATKANLPTARYSPASGIINNKLYVVGGSNGTSELTTLEIYDLATDRWTTGSAMPTPRRNPASGVINNKLYVVGGFNGSILTTLEIYDPVTNSWTTGTAMPTVRQNSASAVINNKLYVVGGYDGTNRLTTLEIYDPATNSWTTGTSMPTVRDGAVGSAINNKLYVFGGFNGISRLATLEIYDPSTNSWTTGAPMPTARDFMSAGVINNRLYVAGGYNGSSQIATLEVYNPATNSWSTRSAMPTARQSIVSGVINNKLYVVGGRDTSALNKLEVYTPEGITSTVLTFSLTVTDSLGLASVMPDTVVITATNNPPVANAGVDQIVIASTTVTLNGSASSDPEGQSLTYRWTQTGGNAVTLSSATTVSPTFTAPASVGMLTFTLAVTDSLGLAATLTDTVIITVMEAPPPFLMTIGSGGTGNGQFQGVHDVAVDSSGNLYAADYNGNRIQKFDSAGNFLTQWGSSGSGNGQLSYPSSLAVDSAGNVYVAEVGNNRIQKFSNTGTYLTQWSVPNVGQIVVDSSGNLYASAPVDSLIRKYDNNGTLLSSWGSSGTGNGQLLGPQGIAIDSSGNLYIADTENHRIQKFTSSGTYLLQWGSNGTGNGQFNYPYDIVIDNSGNLYVTDRGNNRVQKFTSSGAFLSLWNSGASSFNNLIGLTINSSGNLYVADFGNNRVQKFGSVTALSALSAANSSPTTLGNVTYFTATLAAGNDVNYTWNFGDGSVTGSGQPATITHTYPFAGSFIAVITATNSLGSLSRNNLVTVTNSAPIANAGVDQSVNVSSVVTLNGAASSDPDGHLPLIYRWAQSGGTAVTLSTPNSITTTFNTPSTPAVLTFTLTVTDARGQVDSTPDTVVVTATDVAISGLAVSNSSPTTLGQATYFTAAIATGTNVIYFWNFGNGVVVNSQTSPVMTRTYTLSGTYTTIVTATNGAGSVSASRLVTVTNLAPLANAGSDQSVKVGSTVSLNGSGSSDPDGHTPLTYRWAQSGGPAISLSNATSSTASFTAPATPTVLTFTLTVTDSRGLVTAAPDSVVITVQDYAPAGLAAVNSSPTRLNDTTFFTATVVTGTNVLYIWNFGDGALVNNQPSGVMSHTYALSGTYTTIVTATNGAGSATANSAVTVTNLAPIANAGADLSVNVATTVTLNGSTSSDPDGHTPLTYRWQQTGGPAVTLSNAAQVTTTFVAPSTPTVLTFTLTVTDARGLVSSSADPVVINVVDTDILGLTVNSSNPTVLGHTTFFTATTTGGSNIVYSWNFGDGTTASGAHANHVYATVGAYTALVTATNASGSVSASTVVSITNAAPLANAGSDRTVKVGATVTLSGTNSSDPDGHTPLSYGWSQSGGPTVTLSSATVSTPSFTAPATPTVLTFTLTVTDSRGLVTSAPDSVVVTVQDYTISGLALSNSSPTRLTDVTYFTATVVTGTNVLYAWNFGDGVTVSGQQSAVISHTYALAGTYTTIVTTTNGQGSVAVSTPVTITNSAPIADAAIDQTVKVSSTVTLDASSSSDPDGHLPLAYHWQQSGGPSVALDNASNSTPSFEAPSTPTILTFTLTVTDSQGSVSTTPDPVVITVQDYNIAGLSAENSSPTRLTDGTSFTATIISGTNVIYTWNFGDDVSGNSQESGVISHTYGAAGTYEALITATNGQGSVSITIPVTITNAAPIADASGDQVVKVGSTVNLDGAASDDPDGHMPLSYGWTQIGGPAVLLSSATISQPSLLAQNTPTVLTFTLTVTDSQDLRSASDAQVQITIEDYEIGGLEVVNTSPTRLTDVTYFTATVVTGTNVLYTWNFGDGALVNSQQSAVMSHTYALSGTYTTIVTATNGQGSVSVSTPVTITNVAPIADASSDQTVKVESPVTLDGGASSDPDGHTPLTYGWEQIGGTVVTLSDPSAVTPSFVAPTSPAILTFTLTVTDSQGLVTPLPDTVVITVQDYEITGLAVANSSPTRLTEATSFTATVISGTNVIYTWGFGDGDVVNEQSGVISHTYLLAGFYTATVTTSNGQGSVSDSMVVQVTNSASVADADVDQTVKVGRTVTLNGSNSSDPDGHTPLSYGWVQEGGLTVTLSSITAALPTFVAPSTPTVLTFTLTVTDSQGMVSLTTDQVAITVEDYTIGGFSTGNSSPTRLTDATTFTATVITGTNVFYQWDFGDGEIVNSQESGVISHTYALSGTYTMIVTATNGQGSVSATELVTITNSAPVANAGGDQVVKVRSTVGLNGAGSYDPDNHLPLSYGWLQSGGPAVILSSATISQPTFVAPTTPTILTFTLTVTDGQGLRSTSDVQIQTSIQDYEVGGLIALNSSPTRLTDLTHFTATVLTGTNVLYTWDFGDDVLVSGDIVNYTYSAVGIYTATVTASNGQGSVRMSIPVTVTNAAPIANAGGDQIVKVGATVNLNGGNSGDPDGHTPLTYRWQQRGGPTVTLSDATSSTPSFVAPATPTVLTFTLTVTDSQGLVTSLADPVVVTVQDYDITGLALINSSPTRVKQATTFTATLTGGTNVLYNWTFGDGVTVSSQQSAVISHTYAATGLYTATVTASNGQGSSSANTKVQVKVLVNAEASVIAFVDEPASLSYAPPSGGNFGLQVPAGAVSQTTTILYDGLPAPTDLPGTVIFGNRAFRLTASQDDELLSGISFQAPLTITIDYLDSDVAGLDERLLALYYFDTTSNQWISSGIKVVQRDIANNRLVVRVTHFTDFAMVQRQVVHCSQEELDLLLTSGVNQLDLDGACVYSLTESSSGYAFFDLWNKQAMVIDGHGATIERADGAPEKGILAFFQSQNVTVKNLKIRGGLATTNYGLGGGLWLYHSTVTLENMQLISNTANTGGAIQVEGSDSSLLLINSVLANNVAQDRGAALFATGSLTVQNSTLVDVAGNSKQGVLAWNAAAISNTIVSGFDIGILSAGVSTLVSEDYNVFANNGVDTQQLGGGQFANGGHSQNYEELRFVDPANDNFHLKFTSPAIDKGIELGLALDAAGQSRPFVGTGVDVGAYEFQGQGGPALAIYRQNPIAAAPDLSFVYRFLVLNQGVMTATDLIVSDTLPDGVSVITDSISDGGKLVRNQVQWNLATLAPGAGKIFSYRAQSANSVQNSDYRVYSTSNPEVIAIGRNRATVINSQVLASIDFAPIPDGYRFANYGDSLESDLNEADLVTIFGANAVCKTQNPCVLTTSAQAWRTAWLANLQAGHSAGMAISSLRLFNDPSFSPGTLQSDAYFANDLKKEQMRRWIALYAAMQEQTPFNAATLEAQGIVHTPATTPNTVLDTLIANLRQPNAADRYLLLFAKSPAVRGGGWHGVVPYAVQQLNPDEYLIYLYDPNTPNRSDRAIQIKRSSNSWAYISPVAPDRPLYDYFGDATADNFRLLSQQWTQTLPKLCDTVCTAQSATTQGSAVSADANVEFQLDGEGYFLVTRSDGKRVGYDLISGTPILEIPGAVQLPFASGFGLNIPAAIRITHTAGMTYEVTVASRDTAYGNRDTVANFNISGPDYVVRVTNINLTMPLIAANAEGTINAAGQQETDTPFDSLNLGMDPENNRVTMEAGYRSSASPEMAMAINNPQGSDYSFSFGGISVQPGSSVAMIFDRDSGRLSVENNDPSGNSYTLDVQRLGQDGVSNTAIITATDGESVGTVIQLGDSWQGGTTPVTEPNNTITLPAAPQRQYLPMVLNK